MWNMASTLAMQGSVMLTGIVLARLLGLESFGVYSIASTTVMTLVGVAQGGVGIVGVKFVGELLHHQPNRVARVLRMCSFFTSATGIVASVLLWTLAPYIATKILGSPEVEFALKIVSISIFFNVQTVYLQGALQGFGAFRSMSIAGVVSGMAHFLLSVVTAYLSGVNGALVALVVAAAVRWVAFKKTLNVTRKQHSITSSDRVQPEDWSLIWRFGLPAGLASLVTLPCLWGVTAFVARQPNGIMLVGLFSVAHQLRQLVLQLPLMLNSVASSVLGRLKGEGNSGEYWNVFRSNLILTGGFASLVALLVALMSSWILSLYGQNFLEAKPLLLVLMIAVIPEVLGTAGYQLVQSSGRMWRSFLVIVCPRDLIYMGLAILMLPSYGLLGVGLAYLAAHLVGCAATFMVGHGGRSHLPPRKFEL